MEASGNGDFDILKTRLDEAIERETELRKEIESLAAVSEEKQTRYYNLKMENEEFRKQIDRELQVGMTLSNKGTSQLNGLQQDCKGMVDEMDGLLQKYNSVIQADDAMVLQACKRHATISETFTDDFFLENIAKVDQKISEIEREIEKENEVLHRLEEKHNAEIESTAQDSANFTLFNEELKMNNIKLDVFVPEN